MKPVTEVLLSTAFVLTPEEHWYNGRNGGENCVGTAISAAASELGYEWLPTYNAACDAFRSANGIGGSNLRGIWEWNDTPGRVHAEVLAALYKAAELSEAT